jgi:hypothetical protein
MASATPHVLHGRVPCTVGRLHLGAPLPAQFPSAGTLPELAQPPNRPSPINSERPSALQRLARPSMLSVPRKEVLDVLMGFHLGHACEW